MVHKNWKQQVEIAEEQKKTSNISERTIDYLQKFGFELNFSRFQIEKAEKMFLEAEKRNIIAGRNPKSVAGAILYIVSHQSMEYRGQRKIANTVGVSEVSVRNTFHVIYKELELYFVRQKYGSH